MLPRGITAGEYIGKPSTGAELYMPAPGYVQYLDVLEPNIANDVQFVSKVVMPKPTDYDITEVLNDIEINTRLRSNKETMNLVVPIIHWFILFTDKKTGKKRLMNSHGAEPDRYVNRSYKASFGVDVSFVKGSVPGNLNDDICWNEEDLPRDRPLSKDEKTNHTTFIHGVMTMPKYEGLKSMIETHQKPSLSIRYRICLDAIRLIQGFHNSGFIRAERTGAINHISTASNGLVLRLTGLGLAKSKTYASDEEIADDLVRLGKVCSCILDWIPMFSSGPIQLRYGAPRVGRPMITAVDRLLTVSSYDDMRKVRSGEYLDDISRQIDIFRQEQPDAVNGPYFLEPKEDDYMNFVEDASQ